MSIDLAPDSPSGNMYDLRDGFEFTRYRFPTAIDGAVIETTERVEASEYPAFTDDDQPFLDRIEAEFVDNDVRRLREKSAGQSIGYTILNNNVESSAITVVGLPWRGHANHPLARERELPYLARANPDTRFVVFDHLGTGDSDPLPRHLAKELHTTGSHQDYAAIVLGGMTNLLKDYDSVNMLGRSQGGLVVMEMAAQTENVRVDDMMIFDAPGSVPMELWRDMLQGSIKIEGAHSSKYLEYAIDARAAEIQKNMDTKRRAVIDMIKLSLRGELRTQLFDMPGAMSQGTLDQTIGRAMPAVSGRFVFATPRQSIMNEEDAVRGILTRHAAPGTWRPAIVDQVVLDGGHSFAKGSPAALIALENRALNG